MIYELLGNFSKDDNSKRNIILKYKFAIIIEINSQLFKSRSSWKFYHIHLNYMHIV